MSNKEKCFHCKHKWNCYKRQMQGYINMDCTPEQIKQNKRDWKWFELFAETPKERQRARQIYIDICKASWAKQA